MAVAGVTPAGATTAPPVAPAAAAAAAAALLPTIVLLREPPPPGFDVAALENAVAKDVEEKARAEKEPVKAPAEKPPNPEAGAAAVAGAAPNPAPTPHGAAADAMVANGDGPKPAFDAPVAGTEPATPPLELADASPALLDGACGDGAALSPAAAEPNFELSFELSSSLRATRSGTAVAGTTGAGRGDVGASGPASSPAASRLDGAVAAGLSDSGGMERFFDGTSPPFSLCDRGSQRPQEETSKLAPTIDNPASGQRTDIEHAVTRIESGRLRVHSNSSEKKGTGRRNARWDIVGRAYWQRRVYKPNHFLLWRGFRLRCPLPVLS